MGLDYIHPARGIATLIPQMKSRVSRTIGSAAVIAGPMIERALDGLIAAE